MTPPSNAGGKGVYLKVSDGCVDDPLCTEIADVGNEDFVKGVVIRTSWAAVQPDAYGLFDWTALGAAIDEASNANLTVILQIDLIGGGTAGVAPGVTTDDPSLKTPQWVWDHLTDPSQFVGEVVYDNDPNKYIPRLPWFGDAEYQLLVRDLADGLHGWLTDPSNDRSDAIEFIYVTGWQADSDEPRFYDAYVNSNTRAEFLAQLEQRGALIDFNDVLVHSGSPYEDAIDLIATYWAGEFLGSNITLAVLITPTGYSCDSVTQVQEWADIYSWVVIAPNPESNLVGLSYTEINRAFLGALKPGVGKVGIDGLAGYDPTNTTTVSGWVSAIRDCIGFDPPAGSGLYPYTGCNVYANGGTPYTQLLPASNATYILVDYGTEYWGETSFSCITKYANQLCKN